MRQRLWTGSLVFMGMLILILDGKTAIEGAQQGISLCLQTVIPSLFPFIFLSIWISSSLYGTELPLLRPLGRLCGIPAGTESVLLVGFLGGYPVGAQSAANLWHTGGMKKDTAQKMLAFCSNAGPGFLFGMAASLFSDGRTPWYLWGIHILSAIAVAVTLPFSYEESITISLADPMKLTDILKQALAVMASVCGWILLFRVLIAFADRWLFWLVPVPVRTALIGLLELSNGCCALRDIPSEPLRFVLCSAMLAFGGCCVTMQTMSVISGLSMKYYCYGKILQTVLSILLSWSMVKGVMPLCLLVLVSVLFLLRKRKNRSSILKPVGV